MIPRKGYREQLVHRRKPKHLYDVQQNYFHLLSYYWRLRCRGRSFAYLYSVPVIAIGCSDKYCLLVCWR
jgi:hypothetical protein